jgi:hypothetical protein
MKTTTKCLLSLVAAIGTYNAQAAPLNNIVANWHIDEGAGQKVLDSSAYGKHGQLGGSTAADAADPLWISRRFDDAALNFTGGQYVKIPHAAILEPQKISVEAWIKAGATDATVPLYVLAKSNHACSYAAYGLYLHEDATHSNGVPYFYVANSDGSSYTESPDPGYSLMDGKWHHLVGTYDLNAVRLYVDGVQVGTGTPTKSAIGYGSFSQKDVYIGSFDNGANGCPYQFIGSIDEVRIWNKALTASDVLIRYKGY